MTTKERAIMQQALEALEHYGIEGTKSVGGIKCTAAITSLREALANTRSSIRSTSEYSEQAEQEPVGVVEANEEWGIAGVLSADLPIGTKLYAAPVQQVDLSDDEIAKVRKSFGDDVISPAVFARAVITEYKEKNR